MKKSKKVIALALAAMMAVSAFAGCSGESTSETPSQSATNPTSGNNNATTAPTTANGNSAYKMSILLPYGDHANDELDLTIEFRNKLESYTNTDITWEMYDANNYYEKLTLKYASGELATIMVTDKNAEFLSACKYNTFWDITDYIDLFDNLTTIPATTRSNASNNGKIYGVPRARDLGRNACSFRQDWADKLGLSAPKTIEDLTALAEAFTTQDPDGDTVDNTYGFGLDQWSGQWNVMMPWFGVHNIWGLDANGNLEYYAMQPEFKTALKTFRQWNEDGYINPDWTQLSPGAAEKSIFRKNIAGIQIQVADTTRKSQEAMNGTAEKPGEYPEARFTYFSAVDGGYGIRVLPTDGFAGYVAVTKAFAPTKDDLMSALQFLNDLNDAEMKNLIDWGLEGKDYYVDANGFGVRYTADEKTAMGISNASYREGYNQMVPYFGNAEESAKYLILDNTKNSDIRNEEAAIKITNIPLTIPNKGAGYVSAKYEEVGTQLDKIITDAIYNFITGTIDETALDVELQKWLEAGGQTVIDEMNAAYKAANPS